MVSPSLVELDRAHLVRPRRLRRDRAPGVLGFAPPLDQTLADPDVRSAMA